MEMCSVKMFQLEEFVFGMEDEVCVAWLLRIMSTMFQVWVQVDKSDDGSALHI